MIIKAENISKNFNGFTALSKISYNFEGNTMYCITGPSGSGKTTFIKILSGLMPPSEGQVLYDNSSLYKLKNNELSVVRNKVNGFVFQDYFLEEKFSVFENVTVPLYIRKGLSKNEIKDLTMSALEMVGLNKKFNQLVGSLSGGEKQRTAIARAIVGNPDIIFADEPTGNLDQKNGEIIIELFKDMVKRGKMVILVTHNDNIAKLSDKVINILDGKIISNV